MFYQFMKWYLGWMIKLYYRRVYTSGTDMVPNGQPLIYASNHPGGFVEPIILTTNVRQSIHFLVLGSFLTSPYLQWFFKALKMVPIYRRDIAGDQSITKNQSTFQYVHNALGLNNHILIYPEAQTQFIYKLRPLKKGIVRMAYGFLQNGSHDHMYIVPVGVNFIDVTKFRSEVFVHLNEPIKIELNNCSENEWYIKTLKSIMAGMEKVVFNVEDENRHSIIQELVEIKHFRDKNKMNVMGRSYVKDRAHVEGIKKYVDHLDQISDEMFEQLTSKLKAYKKILTGHKITPGIIGSGKKIGVREHILLMVGFPFFILGGLMNVISLAGSVYVKKNLVKRKEYKAGVAAAIPAVLTLIGFIGLFSLGFILHYGFFILAVFLPFSLYLFIYYYDLMALTIQFYRYKKLTNNQKLELEYLQSEILSYQ